MTPRLAWDLFMVLLATLNLYLILFDFGYFWIRPYAYRYVPFVTDVYDPVKAIKPHPVTSGLTEAADRARAALERGDEAALNAALDELKQLSRWMLSGDPFAVSGQTRKLNLIKIQVVQAVTLRPDANPADVPFARLVDMAGEYWEVGYDQLEERLDLFEREMRPLLEINFTREYGKDGRFEDYFWLLDLPFLLFFIVEFDIRWILAVRQKRYPRWYLFPIFHWYDVLGMIPTKHLRIFRLFRIAAIYIRLRKSGLSAIGNDVFSRVGNYFYSIIAEEISDMVALRILSETQEEIRDGTHHRIIATTLTPRREEIQRVVARQVRQTVGRGDVQQHLRELLVPALERAADESESLAKIPLPASVVRPVFISMGQALVEDVLHTVTTTIDSTQGQEALERVVASVIDDLAHGPIEDEIEKLGTEIAIHVLEEMKTAVRVKKWVQS